MRAKNIPDLSKANSGQVGPKAKSTRSPWRIQNRRIKPGFDVDVNGSNRPFWIEIISKIRFNLEEIFTIWFNRGIVLDFLVEFFSSIGDELFVSETSGRSVEEFSLTNDADL